MQFNLLVEPTAELQGIKYIGGRIPYLRLYVYNLIFSINIRE